MANQTLKKPLPTDPIKWAREMGLKGEFVSPIVTETSKGQGAPYTREATIPDTVEHIPGKPKPVEAHWPILFGHPHVNPETELSNIAGIDVKYLGTLDKEGVGVYVRVGEYE